MVDSDDASVGVGVGKFFDIDAAACLMTMANTQTGQAVQVLGGGGELDVGVGLSLPVTFSTDNVAGKKLPGGMLGQFICGPAAGQYQNPSVFQGVATLIGIEGAAVISGGASILIFADRHVVIGPGLLVDAIGLLSIRLIGLVYGLDLTDAIGIDVSNVWYSTKVRLLNACLVDAGPG